MRGKVWQILLLAAALCLTLSVESRAAEMEAGPYGLVPAPPAEAANAAEGKVDLYLVAGARWRKLKLLFGEVDGEEGLFLDLRRRFRAGSYRLVATADGRGEGDVLAYDFQVSAPEIDTALCPELVTGAEVTLTGKFFGKKPKAYATYELDGRRRRKRCRSRLVDGGHPSPFDPDQSYPMDLLSGESALKVVLPRIPEGARDVMVELKSSAGRGVRVLELPVEGTSGPARALANGYKPGDLIQFEFKGRVREKYFFVPVFGYLYSAFACGKSVFDGFMNLVTKLGGWLLITDSKLPSGLGDGVYDADLYAIKYMAAYDSGGTSPVPASGLLAIPRGARQAFFHSFQHGTMLTKAEAPSVSMGPEMGVAVLFAVVDGHVVAIPDHIGLGAAALDEGMEKVFHPYCQAEFDAVGDAYMIPAAKAFLRYYDPKLAENVSFDRPLLGGYSEGGYITLALCRELERAGSNYGVGSVAACCPMAGPLSLSNVMLKKLTADEKYPVQYFAPYLLVTYNNSYRIYASPSDYFRPPYDKTVVPLINGYHDSAEVERAMPASGKPRDAIAEDVLYNLMTSQGPLFAKLKLNDLVDIQPYWHPKADTMLVHGRSDDCVPYDNSVIGYEYFLRAGKKEGLSLLTLEQTALITAFSLFEIKHALYFPYAAGEYWQWLRGKTEADSPTTLGGWNRRAALAPWPESQRE